jgi:hypothetical protein
LSKKLGGLCGHPQHSVGWEMRATLPTIGFPEIELLRTLRLACLHSAFADCNSRYTVEVINDGQSAFWK